MADRPYLVALALVEQNGKRSMPLTGKTQSAAGVEAQEPGQDGETLALELLLRVWQRSDDGGLRRAAGESSLLLIELPLDAMSDTLPVLKAEWIASGDLATFEQKLAALVIRGWRLGIAKYEPVSFHPWPAAA
jgi:hypothetical protein